MFPKTMRATKLTVTGKNTCMAMVLLLNLSVTSQTSNKAVLAFTSPLTQRSCHHTITQSTRLFMSSDPKPLAEEGDWAAYLDEDTTGLIYYFNSNTGESVWEAPTSTFPRVKMSRKEKDRMMEKRRQYAKETRAKQAEAEDSSGGGGLFGSIMGLVKSDASDTVKEETKTETNTETPVVEVKKKEEKVVAVNGDTATAQETPSKSTSSGAKAFKSKSKSKSSSFVSNIMKSMQSTNGITSSSDTAQVIKEPETTTTTTTTTTTADPNAPVQLEIASKVMPHPEKVSWGGEDAIFTFGRTFGVFDGVSGAEKLSGIPLYSTTLAKQMKETVGSRGLTVQQLRDTLLDAAEFADASATGASTAVVASIGEDSYLRALNVGDSGLLVIRDGKVFAKTREIVHYFDCPYQLAELSPDRPKDGTVLETRLLPGDVIFAASDGVFDNLSDEEICQITNPKDKASIIAKRIVDRSRAVSLDSNAQTPYAKMAKRNRYEEYANGVGGKIDDLSCVVVRCS